MSGAGPPDGEARLAGERRHPDGEAVATPAPPVSAATRPVSAAGRPRRVLSDGGAVVLAGCTAVGAVVARGLPLWLALAVPAVALAARRPVLLCLGGALLSSCLAARSWAGLEPPASRPVAGVATLVTDPVDVGGAVRLQLRLEGRRVEAWARGGPAGRLRPRLAGERLAVAGRLAPVTGRRRAFLARQHVAARLEVEAVGGWSAGPPLVRTANDLRRTLVRGAASLAPDRRALFLGFVLGDDRDQDPASVEDFRASGLSHLLAVSGENVAFVLALAAPALRWLGLRARLVATLALLGGFGVLTRWEPSVLRAEAMAAVAVLAVTLGRPTSRLRVLALAVTGVLLVDPLLVGSVGFLLSCGACAGIVVLARPLSSALPVPLAVTVAAQAGVAPVLVAVFGAVPVASVPANLLAMPAAGPVMMWGLVAGLPAGLLGGRAAAVLHVPTRLLVGWVAAVARWGAAAPLGQLRPVHLGALAVLGAVAVAGRRARRPVAVALAAAAALAVTAAAGVWPPPPPAAGGRGLTPGARLWRTGGATVLVVERPRAGPLLAALREAQVRGLDVVVVTGTGTGTGTRSPSGLGPVLSRHPARLVLTRGRARAGTRIGVGPLRVDVLATEPRLRVRVRASPGVRAPGTRPGAGR